MDEQSVRAQLAETRERLQRIDEEREILLTLIHGFEGWLRLGVAAATPTPGTETKTSKGKNEMVGTISMRAAVRKVLRDARGAPLQSSEIFRRVTELGAATNGKRPEAVVDLTARSLMTAGDPIEKVSPRTWRWKSLASDLPTIPTYAEQAAR